MGAVKIRQRANCLLKVVTLNGHGHPPRSWPMENAKLFSPDIYLGKCASKSFVYVKYDMSEFIILIKYVVVNFGDVK